MELYGVGFAYMKIDFSTRGANTHPRLVVCVIYPKLFEHDLVCTLNLLSHILPFCVSLTGVRMYELLSDTHECIYTECGVTGAVGGTN